MTQAQAFLSRWHDALERRDVASLRPLIADDCQFRSPAFWTTKNGAEITEAVLTGFVSSVEGLTYRKEWVDASGRELLLEFTATVDGKSLVGVDRISLDEEGRLASLEVMIRPLNALVEVAARMAAHLSALEGAA